MQSLVAGSGIMEASVSRSATPHGLYFRGTAYNWLAVSHEMAPCFDSNDSPIEPTGYGQIFFHSKHVRDLAFLVLNGKLQFAYWLVVGDNFHVTQSVLSSSPFDLSTLSLRDSKRLLDHLPELKQAMRSAIQFKRNAGKRVGNYNLAKCRHVTDKTDRIFAKHFGLDAVWDDIELLYAQTVKTDFGENLGGDE